MINVRRLSTAALFAILALSPAAYGERIIVVLDTYWSFSPTQKCVAYYDADVSLDDPMFVVFVGFELCGDYEDPESITVNPANGDTYVVAYDSTTAGAEGTVATIGTGIYDTNGDFDLYRINFATVYDNWVNVQNKAYTIYGPPRPDCGSSFDPSHQPTDARVELAGAIEKIGEVARNQGDDTYYYPDIEFVNEGQLVMLDAQIGPDASNDLPEYDHVFRAINRVSETPGAATATIGSGSTPSEGGWNSSTTESWESAFLGYVNLDFDATTGDPLGRSEPTDIAYYSDGTVEGVWVAEDDGGGDDVAFFEITNWAGTAGNGYRELAIGLGPDYPSAFALDDDPCTDPQSNDGDLDVLRVDSAGNLLIGESGYYDVPQHEPKLILRELVSMDDGNGRIDFGAWTCQGPLDMTGLPDDDTVVTDGRFVTYAEDTDTWYIFDIDSAPDYTNDVYTRNVTSGASAHVVTDGPYHYVEEHGIRYFVHGGGPACNDPSMDSNGDGSVDLTDYGFFLNCYNGPNKPYGENGVNCVCFDTDGPDGDVDLGDYGKFLDCYNGPARPPLPTCGT